MLRNGEMRICNGEKCIVIGPVNTMPPQELSHNEYGNAALSYQVVVGGITKIVSESELKQDE